MIIDECEVFEDYRRRGLVFVTPEEDRILQRDKVSWALSLTEEEVASRLKIAQMAQKIRANAISRATNIRTTTGPQAQGDEK